jgi:hypothetical protein
MRNPFRRRLAPPASSVRVAQIEAAGQAAAVRDAATRGQRRLPGLATETEARIAAGVSGPTPTILLSGIDAAGTPPWIVTVVSMQMRAALHRGPVDPASPIAEMFNVLGSAGALAARKTFFTMMRTSVDTGGLDGSPEEVVDYLDLLSEIAAQMAMPVWNGDDRFGIVAMTTSHLPSVDLARAEAAHPLWRGRASDIHTVLCAGAVVAVFAQLVVHERREGLRGPLTGPVPSP